MRALTLHIDDTLDKRLRLLVFQEHRSLHDIVLTMLRRQAWQDDPLAPPPAPPTPPRAHVRFP